MIGLNRSKEVIRQCRLLAPRRQGSFNMTESEFNENIYRFSLLCLAWGHSLY